MKRNPPVDVRQRDLVEMFHRSSRSAGRAGRIEVIETHFAWVFLTPARAYKLKKPVRYRSMDYRTLARRERGCRNEIRLNRRLARSAYLGVVPVVLRKDGSLGLGRGERIVDWVVKMRRLAARRMRARARRGLGCCRGSSDRRAGPRWARGPMLPVCARRPMRIDAICMHGIWA